MLGDNIRKYRKENNLSQEELADKLGVSRQSISLWETGRTQPSVDILTKLASVLEISVDTLLTEQVVDLEKDDNNSTSKESIAENPSSKKKNKKVWIVVAAILAVALLAVALLADVAFSVFQNFIKEKPKVSFADNPSAIEEASQSVVMLKCYDKQGELYSTGSGFAMFEDGVIVTNYHVIEDNVYRIVVGTEMGASYEVASVVTSNKEQDIAILRCETATKLALLEIGETSNLQKGEKVVAIGSPLGLMNTVSTGVFSGYLEDAMLQFTASISSGSSGGALFDNNGKVLGITYASFEGSQNLNLAIPIEQVVDLWKNKRAANLLSLAAFYNKQTPTFSVEYVLENWHDLKDRTFYIEGWVEQIRYSEYENTNGAFCIQTVGYICGDTGRTVKIYAHASQGADSNLPPILQDANAWTGEREAVMTLKNLPKHTHIKVLGEISIIDYYLQNKEVEVRKIIVFDQ